LDMVLIIISSCFYIRGELRARKGYFKDVVFTGLYIVNQLLLVKIFKLKKKIKYNIKLKTDLI